MKIIIQQEKRKITLHLPLRLIRSRFIYRNLLENSNISKKELKKITRTLHKEFKVLRKTLGSFTFLEAVSNTGESITIII